MKQPHTDYVERLLNRYAKLPGTLRRVLRTDRRTALALYRRGIALEVVENAFVLAIARRTFRDHSQTIEPIRCLQYFVPVVDEILQEPPLPGYLEYLRARLVTARVLPV